MLNDDLIARRSFRIGCVAASVFAGLVGLALLAAWFPDAGLHEFFGSVCHQHSDRSHRLGGESVALCVRCLWFYLGLAVGHGWLAFVASIPRRRFAFLVTSLLLAGGHWLLGWLTPDFDFAALRAATGFGVGFAVSAYTLPSFVEWIFSRLQPPQSTPCTYEPIRS